MIGESCVQFIQEAFRLGEFLVSVNETLISRIPEVSNMEFVSQFRPTALCNILVKIITKVIANRLKPIISKLTSSTQNSFVSGRQVANNI